MISLLTLSSSSTLANSPSLEAAARRTIGVSSEHRLRKYLEVEECNEEGENPGIPRQQGTRAVVAHANPRKTGKWPDQNAGLTRPRGSLFKQTQAG